LTKTDRAACGQSRSSRPRSRTLVIHSAVVGAIGSSYLAARPKRGWALAVSIHEDGAAILAAQLQPTWGGHQMLFNTYMRPRILLAGAAALVAGAAVWLALAGSNAGAAGASNQYPFGPPTGSGDFKVPPPPEEPTLVPTIGTKTTQRLYGADPYQEAVSVTQHIWPAALPLNAPGENDNDPDRPWALTLLTPDDPLTDITAVPLVHFPDDAPILYVKKDGIPQVTMNEIKRLGDTGITRFNNVDAFLVGAAANPAVENQL